ncbi:hypothetical protein J2X54_001572 [Duganella sp. 3397]|uniref:hypothetical protein n=1 Tax=Duganella sp. 3397 TaxID=2817732 RepID=UPI002856D64C|nr:hypothetical protein [Duganella sp. 3397]MDR7049124.1 hypothetical protein [Duganella sp. 3397]
MLAVATFGACWLGAVWYWRETRRMPNSDDLVIYLVVLPLLVLALIGLAVWVGRKVLAASAASAAAASAMAVSAAEAPAAAPAAAAQPLAILAGALRMPHGDSAAQLADAMLSRRVSLELDTELQNDSGYPILAGRIADVDGAAQADEMADWLAEHHPEAQFEEEQWRALALGSSITAELALELAPHPALPAYLQAVAAGKAPPPLPQLKLLALMPPEWAPAEQLAGAQWLRQLVVRAGWPDARLAPAVAVAAAQLPLVQLGQMVHLAQLSQMSQMEEPARDAGQPLLCLMVACHSRIGAGSVDDWAGKAILFDSDHPHGRIPGEGAAGLLLADRGQASLFDLSGAALLYPPASAMRGASADGKARGDTDLLVELAGKALTTAQVDPAAIATLTSDSDQRPSRMGEMLGMATKITPELDPGEVLNVTAACGDAGAVATMAALVLAQQQVKAGAGPALCVSNIDPFHRGAVLLIAATLADAA